MLTVGSLFSGIGGLDLGLERAGMRVIWQSEIDPYACRVLAKHWPEVPNHGDIKQVDWADVARPDVLCGGYPCQPFSLAGARKGEEDPRHLWPWVREAIRVLRPRYAILENVRGHLSLGGPTVIGEIAALGYDAEWRIVSAASVGANHRRDRVIIVAYPNSLRMEGPRPELETARLSREGKNVADSDGSQSADGRQREALPSENRSWGDDRGGGDANSREITFRGAGQDPGYMAYPSIQRCQKCCGETSREVFAGNAWGRISDLGAVANWWTSEPDVGRVAHGIPNRVDRLKGLGNAVVPQVAEVIGHLVMAHANANPTN